MKKKLNRKLVITLKHPIANLKLHGAKLQKQHGLTYEFIVKGDLPALLKALEDLPLADIVFHEPNLEEIFINFYKDKENE